MSELYIGAYWSARRESIDACADRLFRFLTDLSALDDVFASWYGCAKSRRRALQRAINFHDKGSVVALLESGRQFTDVGGRLMEDLGFGVNLWNGKEPPEAAGLSVTCGLYSTVKGLGGNCVLLELSELFGKLGEWEHMASVVKLAAKSWQPDWASVVSWRSRQARNCQMSELGADWITYFSERTVPATDVPQAYAVERVEDIGWLVVAQAEPINACNADHLRRLREIEEAIGVQERKTAG